MKNRLVCVKWSYPAAYYLAILMDTSEAYANVVYGTQYGGERHSALAEIEDIVVLCKLSKSDAEELTPQQALQKNKDRIRILPAEEIAVVNSILPPPMFISTE